MRFQMQPRCLVKEGLWPTFCFSVKCHLYCSPPPPPIQVCLIIVVVTTEVRHTCIKQFFQQWQTGNKELAEVQEVLQLCIKPIE